jgi:hypothetical protein
MRLIAPHEVFNLKHTTPYPVQRLTETRLLGFSVQLEEVNLSVAKGDFAGGIERPGFDSLLPLASLCYRRDRTEKM